MIKSVMSSLPIYYMSIFKMPEAVVKELDKIQSNFLWDSCDAKKKMHLVSWEKVTTNVLSGGLGIRRLKEMNESLLTKWWWRYSSELKALWRQVLVGKNGDESCRWIVDSEVSNKASRVWTDIIKVGSRCPDMANFLFSNVGVELGSGDEVSFWYDPWL